MPAIEQTSNFRNHSTILIIRDSFAFAALYGQKHSPINYNQSSVLKRDTGVPRGLTQYIIFYARASRERKLSRLIYFRKAVTAEEKTNRIRLYL